MGYKTLAPYMKIRELGIVAAVSASLLDDFKAAVNEWKRRPSPGTKNGVNAAFRLIICNRCAMLVADEYEWRKRCQRIYLEIMGGEPAHDRAMALCKMAELHTKKETDNAKEEKRAAVSSDAKADRAV